jgi:integrase
MSGNSTRKPRARKVTDRPKKPYSDYPLYPHPLGYWSKKIRGKIHHFGRWGRTVNGKVVGLESDTWKEALEQYKAQADDLHAGRTPRARSDGLTVADLCNHFLTAKLRQREAGELSIRSFGEYKAATDRVVASFGKERLVDDLVANDFEALRADMAKTWGPVRLGAEIQKVRTVFKYAYEAGLLDKPLRFGPQFVKPSTSVMRRHRAKVGAKMLEASEIQQLLDAAGVPFRAVILLGVNAGFGNTDVSEFPLLALDLDGGWLDFPRPKTGVHRRCPLWPETVAALREALAQRPKPRDPAAEGRVFINQRGGPLLRMREQNRTDGVAVQFGALLKKAKLHRPGLGFYTLRHVFRTIADAARDPVAIDLIMGHTDPSMGGHYRERVEDSRLRAVAEHVRQWLFGNAGDGPTGTMSENCGPSAPCGPEEADVGQKGAEGSQVPARGLPADERPVLRLYVGYTSHTSRLAVAAVSRPGEAPALLLRGRGLVIG